VQTGHQIGQDLDDAGDRSPAGEVDQRIAVGNDVGHRHGETEQRTRQADRCRVLPVRISATSWYGVTFR
jgi:hypothetical protein